MWWNKFEMRTRKDLIPQNRNLTLLLFSQNGAWNSQFFSDTLYYSLCITIFSKLLGSCVFITLAKVLVLMKFLLFLFIDGFEIFFSIIILPSICIFNLKPSWVLLENRNGLTHRFKAYNIMFWYTNTVMHNQL